MSEDITHFRLLRGTFTDSNGEIHQVGDLVTLTESQYETWEHKFEPADDDADVDVETEEASGEPEADRERPTEEAQAEAADDVADDPAAEDREKAETLLETHDSWQAVQNAIEDGQADDFLDALETVEGEDGGPRNSVQSAIETRRDSLEE